MRDIKEIPLNKWIELYGHDKKNGDTWVSKGKVTYNYLFDGLELEAVFYTDYIVDGKNLQLLVEH